MAFGIEWFPGIEQAWTIPIFPLLAFPFILLLGRKWRQGGGYLAVGAGALSLFMATIVLIESAFGGKDFHDNMIWVQFDEFVWEVGVYIDNLSAMMAFVVALVGFLVIVYSLGYMKGDEGLHRYYAEISLFVGVMLGLTISDNLLQMFIFWELVGVCSFFLIGFWYHKPEAASAAKKAFLVTRLGDIMFLVGVIMIYNQFHTFSFHELVHETEGFADAQFLTTVSLLLFGGAVGKSAQFPLHVWLPDAMEGPTTVSALIHAATMVKAGVFLVARYYFLFTEDALTVVAWIGAITAFVAASMALVVFDIKRVLAYSTISQLGYMMLALGCGPAAGGYTAGMFHLWNHAFFKALLFLCSGSVIHAVHTNDMRQMGGLRSKMPITAYTMLAGTLSISGMPGLSGFWSKDEIFVTAFHADRFVMWGWFNPILFLAAIAAVLTAFYMFRMWFMTFMGKPRSKEAKHAHESEGTMTVPLIILSIFAIASGWVGAPGLNRFQHYIAFEVHGHAHVHEAVVDPMALIVSLIIFGAGVGIAYIIYIKKRADPDRMIRGAHLTPIYRLLLNKYYLDYAEKDILEEQGWYGGYRGPFIEFSLWFWRGFSEACDWFDRRIIDGVVNGIAWLATHAGRAIRKSQTGIVNHYAALVVLGIVLLIVITFGWDMIMFISDTIGGGG
jgi:NADH-quinone oxidoreductase subunit L